MNERVVLAIENGGFWAARGLKTARLQNYMLTISMLLSFCVNDALTHSHSRPTSMSLSIIPSRSSKPRIRLGAAAIPEAAAVLSTEFTRSPLEKWSL